jgi:hypothetical protein
MPKPKRSSILFIAKNTLHHAVNNNNISRIHYIMTHHPDTNINESDWCGHTPLDLALMVSQVNIELVNILFNYGAVVTINTNKYSISGLLYLDILHKHDKLTKENNELSTTNEELKIKINNIIFKLSSIKQLLKKYT